MKARFYKANDHGTLLQVITELGRNNIKIAIADKNLNWTETISLNEEQSKAFKDFMRENDSEVAFCNTIEGMHIKAKELNLKAYHLGCSCYQCNKEFDERLNSVGISNHDSIFEKQVWNNAIDVASNEAAKNGNNEIAIRIRKLKK